MKKHPFTSRTALALALSSAVLPVVLIGCGGSNGNGPAKTRPGTQPTTVPTTVPTTIPTTPTGTALPELSFTFNSGQKVRFFGGTLSQTGVVNGQITVTGAATAPLQVPPGTYPLTGTLNPTTGRYVLMQGAGSAYNFGVIGNLPTSSADGTFTFTAANGQVEGGVIPRGTVVIPTPTTAPTTTPTTAPTVAPTDPPTTGPLAITPDFTFSNSTSTTFSTAPLNTLRLLGTNNAITNYRANGADYQRIDTASISGSIDNGGTQRSYSISLVSAGRNTTGGFSVGQIIPLSPAGTISNSAFGTVTFSQFGDGNWESASGNAIVRAFGPNSVTLEFQNVRFNPSALTTPGNGSFTLNGTLRAVNLDVRNQ